ncbi:Na+/H+ antiporter subunit C [Roseobacter sp. HKCCD9010]|uniref:NADH-quinone oxidoreductase subunit K n=1 Tax=unclassified Roseobacter TaxID=196798 RepID=UPI001491CFEB|nr:MULTISPECIES: NADH-quinone oxidoreductase subunit K [unclassified Roseobacter]MBF9052348.1 Na+/H+ antiporter subunit C [Rhodobacterales bacterium HKCCD4356]NNV14335.1 Na+/H+ antiporter subunit C [Roseobacter sp. HKCCD7357]NNV18514.1 Na+/H+ antiporter subunit C [Roseobacter sp. HKCCD8768]NNV27952.1 Na+/H+ antiporter subunit C [Roseobacter sp. HKCCD8192]NNV32230.1 Na+/H+ antiporter subunit C [Roseobacter sp. HKCCD9061]
MSGDVVFAVTGALLVGIGLYRIAVSTGLVRRLVAINVLSAGVGSVLIASAYRGPEVAPDAVPQAFVLTGIVVIVAMTAVGLVLVRRIDEAETENDD